MELPAVKSTAFSVFLLVFMMCFTSFVIVLGLGGGPRYTTLEVAIYQALRFDFDIGRAVVLSLIQLMICTVFMYIISNFINKDLFIHNKSNNSHRFDIKSTSGKIIDLLFLFIFIVIVVLPLLTIVYSGINERFLYVIYSEQFWNSFYYSILISLSSALLGLIFATGILTGCFHFKYIKKNDSLISKFIMLGNVSMLLPPFIFITGLFIILRDISDFYNMATILTILVNAFMALPFILAILYQPVLSFSDKEMYLCQNLGIKGWNFFKIICWGRIRNAVGYALALAATMSWGDLSVVTLFGNSNYSTLPYLIYQNFSNYKVNDASAIAFIVLLMSYTLFWLIEEFVSGDENDAA